MPTQFLFTNHLPDKNGELVGELRANGAASMWKKIATANMPPPPPYTISSGLVLAHCDSCQDMNLPVSTTTLGGRWHHDCLFIDASTGGDAQFAPSLVEGKGGIWP